MVRFVTWKMTDTPMHQNIRVEVGMGIQLRDVRGVENPQPIAIECVLEVSLGGTTALVVVKLQETSIPT